MHSILLVGYNKEVDLILDTDTDYLPQTYKNVARLTNLNVYEEEDGY